MKRYFTNIFYSKFPKEVSFEFVSCNTKNFETMSDKWDDLFDDKYFK